MKSSHVPCLGGSALGARGWVLALIFGHAPWVRVGASASSESDERRRGFYAQNAVIEGVAICTPCGARAALVHLELCWGERTQIFCVDERERVGARDLSERFAGISASF